MYLFYETIKKEVDLQDLVDYLNSPLEKLKLLQIKLKEYKEQNSSENKIEIEELIRETDKLETTVFPDLINNYCKLSLEFRNNTIIKESKDKDGHLIAYTSKDLLLKNVAKIIEHINLLDEKFYKYFSFEFLVNSRIIADLGYQENFIDNNYEPIVLKNKYVFTKEDAKKIIDKQLGKKIEPIKMEEPKKEEIKVQKENKSLVETTLEFIEAHDSNLNKNENVAVLLKPKVEESKIPETIFEKKQQPVIDRAEENNQSTSSGGISLLEILLAAGMVSMIVIGAATISHKVSENANKYEEKIQQERIIANIQEQNKEEKNEEIKTTEQLLTQLAKNKEKNNFVYDDNAEKTYKQATILMNKIIEFRKTAEKSPFNNEQITFNAINGFQNEKGQMLVSPRDMIDNGKAYRIDVINGKAQLKISNVYQNECKYSTLKLSNQYSIEANDKSVDIDNMNQVCVRENTLMIKEK